MADVSPDALIGELAESYLNSRCVHVAANLGIADVLSDDPRPVAEVAKTLGVDPTALGRVLRHLASLGVFAFEEAGVRNNDASEVLRSDSPSGLLPLTRMLGLPIIWQSLESLEDTVRTGRPGATFHDPAGFFGYLDTHPDESHVYDEGMTAMTVRRIARTIPHYDFSRFGGVADVGGGRGHLLRAVLDAVPAARGILVDRAQVVKDLPPHDRITVQPGSFFTDQLPAADCYLLSNIIHDWADDEALAILRAVRAAAPQDATLLLFEFVVPDDADEFEASDIDLWMLSLVGGRERTLDEYADLLQQAGWRLTRAVPTEVQTIIEAMPS